MNMRSPRPPPPRSDARQLEIGNLSNDVFEWRTSTGSGPFLFLDDCFAQIFSQIVTIIVKKLSNTNFISSRHIKREKSSLPVDVRGSKTPLLKLTNEAFSPFTCLGINKFVLLTFFSLIKTIYPIVSTKPLLNDAKSPLPVDVRRSKTLLQKLPILTYSIHYLLFFQDPAVFRFKFFRHNSHDLQGRKIHFFIRLLTFTL